MAEVLDPMVAAGARLIHERELPPDEWPRLADLPPFRAAGGLPNPDATRIIVAEADGPGTPIIACWLILQTIHVEPLWVAEAHRGRPGLIRRLWNRVWTVLREIQAPLAFACILDADATNVPMAVRLGFEKAAGDLYFIRPGETAFPREKQE